MASKHYFICRVNPLLVLGPEKWLSHKELAEGKCPIYVFPDSKTAQTVQSSLPKTVKNGTTVRSQDFIEEALQVKFVPGVGFGPVERPASGPKHSEPIPREGLMRFSLPAWANSPAAKQMYCLVQRLRKKGQQISLCKEELEKKATLSKQLSQTEANSVFEIVSRYEESPAGFEHFCADIFRQLGYKAEVTPPANDGGYDILLSRDGETAIMECKCYAANHKIGRPALQKLVGANSSMRASQMWFVTTSPFSAPAAAYGKEQGIQMIDGKRLLELIERSNGAKKKRLDARSLSLTRADFRTHIPPDISF